MPIDQQVEDLVKQYGGTVQTPPPAADQSVEDLVKQYGGTIAPGDITIRRDPAAEAAFDRAPGVPLYQVAPGRPQKELPPIGAKGKDLGRFSGDYSVGQNIQSGYQSGLAGVDRLIGNLSGMAEAASTNLPGVGFGGAEIYKHIGNWAREQQKYREEKAAEYAGGRQDLPSKVIRGATSAVTSLPIMAAATTLGGPVLGMAGLGAVETADQGPMNMLKGAAEGAVMGKFIHILGPAGRLIRIPAVAAAEYVKNVAQGVDHETALANALNMAGLSAIGGPGKLSARELPAHFGQSMIPDIKLFREPLVKNRLNPMEQASQDFLTARGVQTPVSMQTGDPRAAGYEGSVRKSIGGGYASQVGEQTREQVHRLGPEEFSRIGPEVTPEQAGTAVRQKLAGDLEQTRSTLAGQVSPTASTPELAGTKVLEAGKKKIQQFHQAADESYKAAWVAERDPRNIRQVPTYDKNGREVVDEKGSPVTEAMALPVDVTDVARQLKPIADRYERTLSDTDVHASLGLKAMRNFIKDAIQSPQRPLSAVETDLGMLKDAARNENLPELRDESQGLAAASVKALQAKIDQTMAQAHYPGWDGTGTSPALRHLQSGRLNTARKYEVADIYKPFGRNIEQVEPVSAFKRMTWSGDAGIEHLRAVAKIAPEQMPEVGRAFIDGGGNWKTLGAETRKVLFRDPELIKNLDEYYARHERFSGLTEMEPVDLFDKLTAQRGKSNELLRNVAEQAPEQMPGLLRAFVGELWGRVTREGDIQKVQSTLDKWLTMDPKSKEILVNNAGLVKDLDSLFLSLKRLTHEVNTSGSGYIIALNKMKGDLLKGMGLVGGGALGFGGHGAAGATVGAGAGIMAGVGIETIANKAMARLLFDPKFTRLLTEGIKSQTRGDNTGAKLVGDALARMAAKERPPDEPPQGPPTGGGEPPRTPEGGGKEPPSTPPGGGGTRQQAFDKAAQMYRAAHPDWTDEQIAHWAKGVADEEHGAPPGEGTPPAGQGGGIRQKLMEGLRGFSWSDEEGSFPSRRGRPMGLQATGGEEPPRTPGGEGGQAPAGAAAAPILEKARAALDESGQAALQRMRDRGTFSGTKLGANFPLDFEDTKDMSIWGASKIMNGTTTFAKWSKEMMEEAGPEAAKQLKGLLPQLYFDSKKIHERMLKSAAGNLPTLQKVMKMYEEGKAGEDWYLKTRAELEDAFGKHAPIFLRFLAATSPNQTVAGNVTMALKAYHQWINGEPFSGFLEAKNPKTGEVTMSVSRMLNQIAKGEEFGGRKVKSFEANIFGDPIPVTVDRWISRAFGFGDSPTEAQYKFVDYAITQAAKKKGIEPRQMQAAIWKTIKEAVGKEGNTSEPFEVVLRKRLEADPVLKEAIRHAVAAAK